MRKLPITQLLNKLYGGKWRNIPFHNMWVDDEDDNRMVRGVASCLCDDICNHLPNYYLYGDDHSEHLSFGYLRTSLECEAKNRGLI